MLTSQSGWTPTRWASPPYESEAEVRKALVKSRKNFEKGISTTRLFRDPENPLVLNQYEGRQ